MKPSEQKFALNQAILDLYETLHVPRQIDGHVWYNSDPYLQEFERRMKQTKRNEVTAEDINYLFMNNCDSEQSLKYYLPRALDLIANGEQFISEFCVSMKVRQANSHRWPENEREAVIKVLKAMKSMAPGTHLERLITEFNWLV